MNRKETVSSSRLIRAYRVADIPPGAGPAPWSPPALTPEAWHPLLEMRLPIEAQAKEPAEEIRNIRNMIFAFDDIARLTDREIQLILRKVDTKDLAIALKGAQPKMQDRIFSNVSERVSAMIREEMKFSGPVRPSDVEEMQLRIVQTVRQLEVEGPKEAAPPSPEPVVQVPSPSQEHAPVEPAPVILPDVTVGRSAFGSEDVARALRSYLLKEAQEQGFSGRQKAAFLTIALGQSAAARVLKHLNDYEIEDIAQAISELKTVTTEQENEVLEEFEQFLTAGNFISMGGIDFARAMLEKTLGPRRAQQMMDRVTAATAGGFYLLRNIAPNQIGPFISKEHPQTIALILSQLDPNQAAGVLNILPEELQSEVAYRVATLENPSTQVLREIEQSLAAELQAILTGQITEIGGPKKVAEILNMTGRSTEKSVLEKLDKRDPEIAEEIVNQMFTFDDIARLTDREIQMLLKEVDKKDLAISLKGARPEMQDRIFSNVSEQVAAEIKQEMEFSGPIRMSDVEGVQLRIVRMVRQLEEAGEIRVTRGETQDVFV